MHISDQWEAMLKKAMLVTIVILQITRLASASLLLVELSDNGTTLNFSSALTLVNQELLNQLNPVKTLLNVSTRMADTSAPVQPAKSDNHQRPFETSLIVSSTPELVKTNSPMWPGAGFAVLSLIFMVLLLIPDSRDGVVLCRIQHLFSRAREGICASAIRGYQDAIKGTFPLTSNQINGNFLFIIKKPAKEIYHV